MMTANLTVNVSSNTAPILSYTSPQAAVTGQSLMVLPATGLSDNGSINSIVVQNVTAGFTGMVTVNAMTGAVTIANAGPPGTYIITIRATDNCGGANGTTDASFTLNVGKANTTTAIIGDTPDPSVAGQAVIVAYGVAPVALGTGTPTGNVTVNASTGESCIGTATAGACAITFANVGARILTASYGGDVGFNGSISANEGHQVAKANTTVTVNSSANPSVAAQNTTFTATILPVAPGGGAPTGTVIFTIDGTPQASLTLVGSQASFSTSGLSVGNHTITASYSGDANFNDSNGSLTQVVNCPAISLSPATLPNATVNLAYGQTFSAAPVGGSYSFAVTSGALPAGLTLLSSGVFSGAPMQSGTFNFRITATGFGSCTGFKDYVLAVDCPAITVNPPSLPGGTLGMAYNQSISASPAGTYSYGVSSGALPIGLTLNAATGAITGTPSQSGSFSFTIAASAGGCSGARNFTVVIECPGITLASLAGSTAGVSYAGSVAASPSGSYVYSIVTGNLPSGLTLNTSTGAITGLPLVTGTYNFSIKAQVANGCSGTQSYVLVVTCPTISLSVLSAPTLNSAYSQSVIASPSGGSYSYAVTEGSLPAGLSLNSATGLISGTPTTAGAYSFTIRATGFGSCSGSRTYTGTITNGSCPSISLPSLPNGQPAQFYSQSVTATPSGSYSYAVTTGTLPPGLTLYGAFGLIYGYPTQAGSFDFTITATDNSNCTGQRAYRLTIGAGAMALHVANDFDGDGKTDLAIWRGATGEWLILRSSDDQTQTAKWGSSDEPYRDLAVSGDYDGDGKADIAVFRRGNGHWYIKQSSDGQNRDVYWGVGTDIPVPGDYDGDGKTDIAVWRGAETNWYILRSSDGQTETVSWGTSNAPYRDLPVPADYDGDGKADIAVFRQENGHWYIKRSSDGVVVDKYWGQGTDVPVPADYDGDGKADVAVWRGSDANWYIVRSSDGATQIASWGTSSLGDIPLPGDYDGDGKADVAVWRVMDGNWYAKLSRDNSVFTKAQGQTGDRPTLAKPQP
jgi:hypothetical protein